MRNWKLWIVALFLGASALPGCSQPCCLRDFDPCMYQRVGAPDSLPSDPDAQHKRILPDMRPPTTVDDLDRDPNYVTLQECVAMALEKGTTGSLSARQFFGGNLSLNNLFNTTEDMSFFDGSTGTAFGGIDSVRVFALRPAISGADIESSLARYDVVLRSILGFNTKDQNTLGPNAFSSGQFTSFGVTAAKGLPTGGEFDFTFGNPTNAGSNPGSSFYNNFNQRNFFSGSVNPSYTATVTANYTQPLLRGFGPYINSMLQQHPLSPAQQYPGSPAASSPPILIARINYDQSRAEFERIVNYTVLNVEASYFQLYALYVNLYSTEQALKQAYTTWKISKAKYEAGAKPITEFANTRVQYEDFRSKRMSALSKVLEQERELRLLTGLPAEDGKRLVPVDTPTVAKYMPDSEEGRREMWNISYQEAMNLRPELAIARQDIARRQAELTVARNNMLPSLNFEASYNIRGFGTRLDGDGTFANGQTDNAFRDLIGNHFSDYNVGLSGSVPLGFRAQNAALRQANLKLAQSYLVLRDQEVRAQNNLEVAYRLVISDYHQITIRRAQREAAAEQVEARFKEFIAGKITVDFLLTAQQQWADALSQEYQAIASYNIDLALFQFTKGTLLRHNGIQIAESPTPQCIQVRAVDHEHERAAAIALRDRAMVAPQPESCLPPALPYDGMVTPSLPTLMMDGKNRVPTEMNQSLQIPGTASNSSRSMPPGLAAFSTTTGGMVTVTPAYAPGTSLGQPQMSLPTTPGMLPVVPNRQ